jgi:hypothetical protein
MSPAISGLTKMCVPTFEKLNMHTTYLFMYTVHTSVAATGSAYHGKQIAHIIDLCMQDIGKYNSEGIFGIWYSSQK